MKYIKLLFYYLYSTYFCLRYLPFSQAKKLPILIHPFVKIKKLHKGDIVINGKIWKSMISIGFEGTIGRCNQKTMIYVNRRGHIVFNGYACISKGCRMVVYQGNLTFGAKLTFNGDCFFSCYDDITFGNDIICGWNASFLTTNGHTIIVDGISKEKTAPIVIGNHVWIGADSVINKGVSIPNGCVIAHHSVVTKVSETPNAIYGGYPAKLLKTGADWEA